MIVILPEIDWQPLVFSGRWSVWGGLGWCRYTPGGSTSSHCPTPSSPHAPGDSPSDHCKTLPCTKERKFSKTQQCHHNGVWQYWLYVYLKYWLAAASMALWQGKSCPWTHSTTSVSSLFTRRVSIPLWSSDGRPPSSQRSSLEQVRLSLSSSGLESSPNSCEGQSVVLSSEALIFYTRSSSAKRALLRKTSVPLLRVHLHQLEDPCGLHLQQFSHAEMWICFFLSSSCFLFLFWEEHTYVATLASRHFLFCVTLSCSPELLNFPLVSEPQVQGLLHQSAPNGIKQVTLSVFSAWVKSIVEVFNLECIFKRCMLHHSVVLASE